MKAGYGLLLTLVVATATRPDPEPFDARDYQRAYVAKLNAVRESFSEDVQRLREQYTEAMRRADGRANLEKELTTRLWANRYRRLAQRSRLEWLAILGEPYEVPAGLSKVNATALAAVNESRKDALSSLEATKKESLTELKQRERDLVRMDRVQEATQARNLAPRIENANVYNRHRKAIAQTTAERARKVVRARNRKREWEPIPPPDAEFLFQENNPAFEVLKQSVAVESSGYHGGPFSRTTLGRLIDYQGTRGLSVVAVNGGKVLLEDTYDTYAFAEESNRLIEDLKAVPYGTFLILAVRDDATRRFTGSAQSTLTRFGAKTGIKGLPYRSSYLMVGIKGLEPGQAVERDDIRRVRYEQPQHAESGREGNPKSVSLPPP